MRLLEKFIKFCGLKTKPSLDYFVKIKAAQRYDHTCHPTIERLRQLEEKGLIYKQGSGPRVRYSV